MPLSSVEPWQLAHCLIHIAMASRAIHVIQRDTSHVTATHKQNHSKKLFLIVFLLDWKYFFGTLSC